MTQNSILYFFTLHLFSFQLGSNTRKINTDKQKKKNQCKTTGEKFFVDIVPEKQLAGLLSDRSTLLFHVFTNKINYQLFYYCNDIQYCNYFVNVYTEISILKSSNEICDLDQEMKFQTNICILY